MDVCRRGANSSGRPPKEKRRNSEKRKERSRDAARCRRSKECDIFGQLAVALPLPYSVTNLMDKAAIMRVAISYLKTRQFIDNVRVGEAVDLKKELCGDSFLMKTMDGFLFIVSGDGDMVYLSDNVHQYLGLSQFDLMGQSIFEYCHPCDHDELKEMLAVKNGTSKLMTHNSCPKSFFIRMKCTLTSKGKSANLKSANYKVIHCTGQLFSCDQQTETSKSEQRCLVSLGEPIPHPSNIEIPLGKYNFLSKHSLDMKFTYADERISDILGYSREDLIGKSMYSFYHALDSDALGKCFKTLFSKGQCETGRYRFLAKYGGYVWVLTQATLICGTSANKPQCVVCVNFLLSGVECASEIVSSVQVAPQKPVTVLREKNSVLEVQCSEPVIGGNCVGKIPPRICDRPPLPCTNKMFAPRTEDMNKGYLMFDDDNSDLTVLKDEPDDLTHLAPTAGDECVSLDAPKYIFDDIFMEHLCGSSLVGDLEPMCDEEVLLIPDAQKQTTPLTNDPFLCNRQQQKNVTPFKSLCQDSLVGSSMTSSINKIELSPASLDSGCLSSTNSPSHSIYSLGSNTTELDFEMDGDEFTRRAPFIPMGDGDDFLFCPEDRILDFNLDDPSPVTTILPLEDCFVEPEIPESLLSPPAEEPSTDTTDPLKSNLAQLLRSTVHRQLGTVVDSPGYKCTNGLHQKQLGNLDIVLGNHDGMSCKPVSTVRPRMRKPSGGSKTKICPGDTGKIGRNRQQKIGSLLALPPERCSEAGSVHHGDSAVSRVSTLAMDESIFAKRSLAFQNLAISPNSKKAKLDTDNRKKGSESTSSVLLNLLISGQDISHGYSCSSGCLDKNEVSRFGGGFSTMDPHLIDSLFSVTQQVAEVNAPVHSTHGLLQGQELLNALDQSVASEAVFI